MNEIDRMVLITYLHENIRHSNREIKGDRIFAMISGLLIEHFDDRGITSEDIMTLTRVIIACNDAMARDLNK